MTFRLSPGRNPKLALERLSLGFDHTEGVIGIGAPFARAFPGTIPGLRTFPSLSGVNCTVPATQKDLWVFLRGNDRGEIFDRSRILRSFLEKDFALEDAMDTFFYHGRDLSGYEDGTENPKGDEIAKVAFVPPGNPLAGSSFVAVQRWIHDLKWFQTHPRHEQDNIIGRKQKTNEELDQAPDSAHVKRTAQESFNPPAFMLRRSMPWATVDEQGLEFIVYGHSLDPFERVLRRMVGEEDGIPDALFSFSRPVTGGYYWCPPVKNGKIDLTALGFA